MHPTVRPPHRPALRVAPRNAITAFLLLPLVLLLAGCSTRSHSPSSPTPTRAGSAAPAQHPDRPRRQYTIGDFMNTTRMMGVAFSPDERRILVSSDESGIFNAYAVDATAGTRTQLTRSTQDSTYGVSYFPADDRILFTRDAGGDENNHLYVRETDGSERDLTPVAGAKASFAGWSRDDRSFYVLLNERNRKFFDLYAYDTRTYERRLVHQDDVGYDLGAISDDGQWLALGTSRMTADSDIHLHHLPTGKTTLITAHQGHSIHNPQCFDRDNRFLYYLTNEGSDFTRVRRYELATGRHSEVERARWDVEFTGFSHNGRYRYTGINEDGRTAIRITDGRSGRTVRLPDLPAGEIRELTFSRSEEHAAFYLNGDRSPSDLWCLNLRTGERGPRSRNLSPALDPDDLVDASVVRFKSFDGLPIPNILFKPHQASPATPAPAIVLVHGGPGGQTRLGYNSLAQFLANHGYVVLGINNRGSSGYGQKFFTADDRKHGREPLQDCVEARQWLARQPWVDGNHIGIVGGSYGGYMVLAALAFQPDTFTAGVDIFGVANWVRTLESIPPYWESFRLALYQEIGHPEKDRDMLRAISPVFHADRIRRPLLVIQGANDPRVIKAESDDIVAAVRRNGVPVDYVVFPDEGHGFTKKQNQLTAWDSILGFLDKHLKPAR